MILPRPIKLRLTLMLAGIVAAAACARTPAGGPGPEDDPGGELSLVLELDRPVYRPGEPVVARVSLINGTAGELPLRVLDGESVGFYFGLVEEEARMDRRAVSSELEPMDRVYTLNPGEQASRRFLLTRLTRFSGELIVQAHYNPNPFWSISRRPRVYSNAVVYEVQGQPWVERDTEGLILESEAVRLALESLDPDAPVTEAQTLLRRNERGFLKWIVNLRLEAGDGEPRVIGVQVDPYWGRVDGRVEPFEPRGPSLNPLDRLGLTRGPSRVGRPGPGILSDH